MLAEIVPGSELSQGPSADIATPGGLVMPAVVKRPLTVARQAKAV